MPRVIATVAARMTSTRLPGKILKPILGRPSLELMLERVRRARLAGVVVATTVNAADDPVAALAEKLGCGVFRGSEHDVLGRIAGAARAFKAQVLVELTSDCIAIDPAAIDQCVDSFLSGGADYVANVLERSYPVGMDTQVFSMEALESADRLAKDPDEREHVGLFTYRRPAEYRLRNVKAPPRAVHPELHLTLDTAEDYSMLTALFEGLHPSRPNFDSADIIAYLAARPEVAALNGQVVRKKSASEYYKEAKP